MTIQHKFVELIPDQVEDGILYITVEYNTAIHKCVCGCGNEVVTPLSPSDWKLTYDGKTISLYPSIGNWQFKCRSHYWIERGQVIDANKYPDLHKKKRTPAAGEKGNVQNREKKHRWFPFWKQKNR